LVGWFAASFVQWLFGFLFGSLVSCFIGPVASCNWQLVCWLIFCLFGSNGETVQL